MSTDVIHIGRKGKEVKIRPCILIWKKAGASYNGS